MPTRRHTEAPSDPFETAPLSASLRALARRGEVRRLRKGVQIITEGDIGDTLYIVLAGRLRAYSVSADGREVTYGIYGAGEYVGEMSLDGGPRAANVETLEPTLCVPVLRATLEAHLDADPRFAFELLAKVIRRARAATTGMKQIALNDVYGRLKLLLEELTLPQPDGTRVADPAPSQLAMSQLLGCDRSMVSRVMKDLERGGYIQTTRLHVVLLRPLPQKW